MDVILHAGAHRTGTTSFQSYLRANRTRLQGQGIGFWGPWRTRTGLLDSVAARPESAEAAQRAAGRVALNLEGSRRQGVSALVVTDENMIGALRRGLRARALYPGIGERMARLHGAFGGPTRIVLQIRALDDWWTSALTWAVPRGEGLPRPDTLEAISRGTRGWRDVITDLACACPGTQILVTEFDTFAARPDRLLAAMTGRRSLPPALPGAFHDNRRPGRDALCEVLTARGTPADRLSAVPPGGAWALFDDRQAARLRETYADDLFWLRAGADGLATLTEDPAPARPRLNLAAAAKLRGTDDDRPARKLAP
ncbi:hypothetical protein [Maliponia aquimaris]|uniref:Sulfotransferase family protein n=1 Tax=Maliponia aquimaris TaxID=1673631 RepID=A0A238L330_9RHOB|nr:hypothetical protein [Maliponia aquimaris]SMX49483.1 hypothetical protein MAA8898_04310 [Maliponia aquimaris]